MPKDHFVPQHYLRHFGFDQKRIVLALLSPYRFIGLVSIEDQCQGKNFYEGDERLNGLIWQSENDLAPVLDKVINAEDFTDPELNALKMLAVFFYIRTRKSAESIKVFPKYMAKEVLQSAIDRGELPPPPEGKVTEDLIDFSGASALGMSQMLNCFMEMQTLGCKLLKADEKSCFFTSDNPVAVLNQFCSGFDRNRSFIGFSKSGFQLVMPISPKLCLFFFDPKIYKVGGRRDRCVRISTQNVEIINALQIQTADKFLCCHDPSLRTDIEKVVHKYIHLKKQIGARLRVIPGKDENEELLHVQNQGVELPATWTFCTKLRHICANPGDRRDPAWTALNQKVHEDIRLNPTGGDLHERIEKILNQDDQTLATELARFHRTPLNIRRI